MAITVPPDSVQLPGPWNSRYPLPLAPEKIYVTFDMAGDWLDNRFRPASDTHKQRRTSSKAKVEQYARDMANGNWADTHEALAFDINGWLQDGQHRLRALRLSKVEGIDFWVFPDMDPSNFDKVDVGIARSAQQLYSGPYAKLITAAVRYLVPGKVGQYARQMTVSEQLEFVRLWPEMKELAAPVYTASLRNHIPSVQHLAVIAQASRSAHYGMIEGWLQGVKDGWGLEPGDTRGHLRNRDWRNEKMNAEDTYAYVAKAWNYYVSGRRVQQFKFSVTESTPAILGLGATEVQGTNRIVFRSGN